MIQAEYITHAPGVTVVRHWSDLGVKLRQVETGELFNDAVDLTPCAFTYEETDTPIDDEELDDEEALAIITGGAE